MARINLVENDFRLPNGELVKFNDLDINSKREAFIIMNRIIQNLHSKDMMVTSFLPSDIYYDNDAGVFYFDKIKASCFVESLIII